MPETKSITRDSVPQELHQQYIDARMGKIPKDLEVNSFVWDEPDGSGGHSDDGRSWIEWLFDIRFPQSVAAFTPLEERLTPFIHKLVMGIRWEKLREKLDDMRDSLSEHETEALLILLDLVDVAAEKDEDLRHVRLTRRPQG